MPPKQQIEDAVIIKKPRKLRPKGTIDPNKAPKYTDINKILKQRKKNPLMTITDQAALNGIDKSALSRLLKRHNIDVNHMEDYKQTRADLFSGMQDMVLSNINESAVKKMLERAPMAAVNLFGVLYDKERLERGQSTSNVATILATTVIEAGKQWKKEE